MPTSESIILDTLRRRFRLDRLRPGQSEILERVMAGRHADFNANELRIEIMGKTGGHPAVARMEYALITLNKGGVVEEPAFSARNRFVRPPLVEDIDLIEIVAKRTRNLQRLLSVVQLAQADDPRAFVLDYFELDEG